VTVQPALVERAVVRDLERRRAQGESRPFNEYHALQEQIHDLDRSERSRSLESLHQYFFQRLGFADLVPPLLAESPSLSLPTLVCETQGEEGAYASPDHRTLLIQMRPERFSDAEATRRWLRHELAHLEDILDPAFGYREEPVAGPDAGIIRERFALLWSVACIARLVREKRAGDAERIAIFQRFEEGYRKLGVADRAVAFRAVWTRPRWTHSQLMTLAADPIAGVASNGPAPGGPCPLCAFPTHAWVLPGPRLTPTLAALVQRDYPRWRPEQGLCDRCTELAELNAGTWWVRAS